MTRPTPPIVPGTMVELADVLGNSPWSKLPTWLVPLGARNLALGRPVTSSGPGPIAGVLSMVTDGDTSSMLDHAVELGAGRQWVQIDLGTPCAVYAVIVRRQCFAPVVPGHVLVQSADNNALFTTGVHTLFDGLPRDGGAVATYVADFQHRPVLWLNTGGPTHSGLRARYLRVTGTASAPNGANNYSEMQVVGVTLTELRKLAKPATAPILAPVKRPLWMPCISFDLPMFHPLSHSIPQTRVEPQSPQRRLLFAPVGTTNVALHKPVTNSAPPLSGSLDMVTDGEAKADESTWVTLPGGPQWIQIDLGQPCALYGILVVRLPCEISVYWDVVVQVADDAGFTSNVRTVFNNDWRNETGHGAGGDKLYYEPSGGKLIDCGGLRHTDLTARYVRLYSKGSNASDRNEYAEVQVYGLPGSSLGQAMNERVGGAKFVVAP